MRSPLWEELSTARASAPAVGPTVRLLALDVARAAAIVGMLVVNVGPRDGTGAAGRVFQAAHGHASVLFVLLAGVGISLLTRRMLDHGSGRRRVLLWRAGILLLIGLALQLFDHDVSVILPTYAALFVLAIAFVRLPGRWLLAGAGATALLSPLVWIGLQRAEEFDMAPAGLTDPPQEVLASILVTGPYPLITWLAPFLLGMWLGRQLLSERRFQVRLLIVGAGAAIGGVLISQLLVLVFGQPGEPVDFDRLVSAAGHSQMPLWLLSAGGSALVIIAVLLLVVPRLGRLVRPFTDLGQLSLTVYVAHLVVLATLVRPGPDEAADGLLVSAVIAVIAGAGAVAWRARFARGPLETVLRLPTRRPSAA